MNSAHSYTEGAAYTEPENNIEEFLKQTEPTKENSYIDLSKCSEGQRKQIAKLILIKSGLSMSDYLDLLHGKIDEPGEFYLLEYAREQWHLSFDVQKHKTEIPYPQFIKLFEGGEENTDTDKCEKCAGRTALITGTLYYDPHSEPYMNGIQEESNVNGGECWVGAYKCDECSHIQGLWIE